MWLWAYYSKIPIYPIFYLLKGDHKLGTWTPAFEPTRNRMPQPLGTLHSLGLPWTRHCTKARRMKLLRTIQRRTLCRDLSLRFGALGSGSTGQIEEALGRLGVGNFPYPHPHYLWKTHTSKVWPCFGALHVCRVTHHCTEVYTAFFLSTELIIQNYADIR